MPLAPHQPGPPPKKKSGLLGGVLGFAGLFLVGVLVVIVRAVAGMGGGTPEAGECVGITGASGEDFDFETTTCGTPDSDHEVVQVKQGYQSCDGDYSEITEGGTTLCLIPDVVVGDCQKVPGANSAGISIPMGIDTKVPCGDPEANIKIVTVAAGTLGEELCADDAENYAVFDDPPKTFCFKSIP